MGQHELDMTEMDAIATLAGIDWEPDDPAATSLLQFAQHTGLTQNAARDRLMKLVNTGALRTFEVRRLCGDGSTRTVRVWKRVTPEA